MIKLPISVNPVSVGGGAALPAAPGGDGKTASTLPEAFLTLLGQHLPSLTPQLNASAPLTAAAKERLAEKAPASELSSLLTALEKPDALSALLTPEKTKEGDSAADDKQAPLPETLSAADQQALQALFAMLPAAPQPAIQNGSRQPVAEAGTGALPRAQSGSLQQTLALINAPLSSAQADGEKTTPGAAQPDASITPVSASNADGNGPSAFRTVLNGIAPNENKQNEESLPPHALHTLTAVMNSASAVTTAPTPSATAMTPGAPQISAQLGSPEWQQAVSQQVLMFSRNGEQKAELRLHPEDLGAIQISLTLDNDRAQLNMVSGHSQVRAALEAALPHLRNALAENGINLSQSSVSSDAFPQSQSFSGQQEPRQQHASGAFSLTPEADEEITPLAAPASLQARAAGSSAVDTFA
ncbi:flagellar hook-length control protein FliK [Mixta tenebrionis]|uniref:Flagellar hook-length control protein FliK n=1 Tax=Mixta tenebrionis TaxID=2562439 RepID=A0A506UZV3_9GAMM|nr:flagellar hook-length control protein FliK [Mixta tenebrionis]TPW38700.1 flagellar hook-length control protein FliK [Mixta tenebrionis]